MKLLEFCDNLLNESGCWKCAWRWACTDGFDLWKTVEKNDCLCLQSRNIEKNQQCQQGLFDMEMSGL